MCASPSASSTSTTCSPTWIRRSTPPARAEPRPRAPGSELQADLPEVALGGLVGEGLGDLLQGEDGVDHRLDAVGLDRGDHLFLVLARADGDALDAHVLGHGHG